MLFKTFEKKKKSTVTLPFMHSLHALAAQYMHVTSAASGDAELLPRPQQAAPCCSGLSCFVCSAISGKASVFLRRDSKQDVSVGSLPTCSRTSVTALLSLSAYEPEPWCKLRESSEKVKGRPRTLL